MKKRFALFSLVLLAVPLVALAASNFANGGKSAKPQLYPGGLYDITVDGERLAGNITLSSASGTLDAQEVRSSGQIPTSVTLTRAYSSDDLFLYDWMKLQQSDKKVLRGIKVVLHDASGGPDTYAYLYRCYAGSWGVINIAKPNAKELFSAHCDSSYVVK